GERTTGLEKARITANDGAGGDTDSPRETVRLLEGQITGLRGELGELVTELDRRRHEALDVKLQVRRHAREITLAGVVVVGVAAGVVWANVWRSRRRQRFGARMGRFQHAMSRMIERPERVAAEPTVTKKMLVAVATAAAATLIKKVLERGVQQVMERRRLAATDPWSPAHPPARPKSPTAA
ncbi:MAG: hypothetical protein ACREJV_14260, partial [Candidatus Rokuibacteriota bacterium]